MKLTIVVAHDPNLVIGLNGGLPWRYPQDLKHFRNVTLGNTIIMGRGVFEELNEIPLPGRKNVVLSTTKSYHNVLTFKSLEEALKAENSDEVFIIGGGVLYHEVLPIADKLVVTEVAQQPRHGLATASVQAVRPGNAQAHGRAAEAGRDQDRRGLGSPDSQLRAGQQPHQGPAHQRGDFSHAKGA